MQQLKDVTGLVRAVRSYDDFNEANDPYNEHDFGELLWAGETIFWVLDYYDTELRNGEDPLSPLFSRVLTIRVLTIMLSCEY